MKVVKKILKYIGIALLSLLLLFVVGSYLLYVTADMKQPDLSRTYLPEMPLRISDSLRTYGNNTLLLNKHNLWELYVRGEPFERGVAVGKMSEDLLYFQEKVFVDEIRKIVPSDSYLKFLRYFLVIFNRNLGKYVPRENREEIYGISLSCTDEFDAIGTPYQRQLNYHAAHDIGHMMQSYMLVGCSSFGVWGGASTDSALIVGRNFDFYVGDDFARNKVVTFLTPTEGYKFASVGWIGMTGVLSGMNETGLTVTINASQASVPVGSATPVSILARIILQYASTIEEAYEIARQYKTFVAESLLIGSANDGKAAIIEKSPDKIGIYYSDSDRISCTNHYQSDVFRDDRKNTENIQNTDSDYRLHRLNELLDKAEKIDVSGASLILRDTLGMGDKLIGLTNEKCLNQFLAHHSVIFKPQELKMWVSTSPWQLGEYVAYDLKRIFNRADSIAVLASGVEEDLIIPEDAAIKSGTYEHVLQYRNLKSRITDSIKNNEKVDKKTLDAFLYTNPDYYYTYCLIGDYYFSDNQKNKAVEYWQQALEREIPRTADKEAIEKKIKKGAR